MRETGLISVVAKKIRFLEKEGAKSISCRR